ncbi:FSR family fosmidomycin resistance protein-like MFS transporter [Flavobacterium cauense R2A-7]|uniref:FSR family fosmidomycin resistance protein-like MFS transporter n=1 Tax=Flavobacterium cauense R2A-7 TaxID=1341154 RepID=A0A562LSZ1_9FLAO|nr:MFS transporter [Flavobacterium cauense]KGO82970.1 Fosmidomycin resistance protein [Flavobacterium cauense R2A-7]TWI10750.1 FSR family fosmidomycin resistance protein-like MFS transporter [Flavobacterium cauense R2A-7]
MKTTTATASIETRDTAQTTVYSILFSICFAHLLNDLLQAVIPAMYPVLKANYALTFTQVGLITFTYQVTASLLQPFVGIYTDKHPKPYSLAFGMLFSLGGIIMLSQASSFPLILASVALVGIGSSIFHPEASRVAFLGSGGKRGLAQSIFQLGGNTGTAIGPLLVALIVIPRGQSHILWFVLVAIVGIVVLSRIAVWYKQKLISIQGKKKSGERLHNLSPAKVKISVALLLILIFSKSFYTTSMSSYFTFYLIEKFHISVLQAQYHLFAFLGAVAVGTLIGGPLGDKFGRKYIIWFSILGAAPFTLMLPFANLFWTGILSVIIGIVIASAFSAILVYAQELMPERVGMISGLFFGFAFGIGGLGSAVLGYLADQTSIEFVYAICSFLPLIGIIAYFLPNLKKK